MKFLHEFSVGYLVIYRSKILRKVLIGTWALDRMNTVVVSYFKDFVLIQKNMF